MFDRNFLLSATDDEFIRHCTLEFFKASGAGGQHRNKTSSAVRVIHTESGLRAEDCSERSQHRNRSNAIYKLKMIIAMNFRCPPEAAPPRMECSLTAPDYPLVAAMVFDILEYCSYDHKKTAQMCGISPSALLKKLHRDPLLFQKFCRERETLGLPLLKV